MADLEVSVLSPAKALFAGKARQLLVPASLGEMGVLPGHIALVAELGMGEMVIDAIDGGKQSYFVSGGYVDVAKDEGTGNRVTVLVDLVERAQDINVARAEKAKQRAEERLNSKQGVDLMRAQSALERATKRLTIAGKQS